MTITNTEDILSDLVSISNFRLYHYHLSEQERKELRIFFI
jgi:hypothetical protein